VQQRCREQQLGVHVDLFELAQGAAESVRAVAVVEQGCRKDAGGGIRRRARQRRVRGHQLRRRHVRVSAGIQVCEEAQAAESVANLHAGKVGYQAAALGSSEVSAGAHAPVDGSCGRCGGRCRGHGCPSSRLSVG
jgi:hypothetical protein